MQQVYTVPAGNNYLEFLREDLTGIAGESVVVTVTVG